MDEALSNALRKATRGLVIHTTHGPELVLTAESGVLDRTHVASVDEARSAVEQTWGGVHSREPEGTSSALWDGSRFWTVIHVLERP